MKILIIAVLVAISAGMVYLAFGLEHRRKKYINGLKKFAEESRRFEGTVMNCTNEKPKAVILHFRDEEQKKTIVHRYMFSRKHYAKNAPVTLYYNERNDSVCVDGDNPFVYKAMLCAVGSALCTVAVPLIMAAAVMVAVG